MEAGLQRIMITGASGFVGRHLVRALAAAFPQARLITEHFDVTDPDAAVRAMRENIPDACIHLAGVAAPARARQHPDEAWRTNLHGSLVIARAIMAEAPRCLLAFVSSGDAYGASFRTGRALDEAAPLAPLSTYAATKAAADLALGALSAEGLRAVRLRPFNHIGPGQSADFAVAAFARQVIRIDTGRQPPVLRLGMLDPQRDFLDVRDICTAYIRCLERREELGQGTILNLASGTPRRMGDVLATLLSLAGVHAEVEVDPALVRRTEIPFTMGDARRARALLGWRPTIAWEQTLSDILEDWRARIAAGE